MAPFQGANSFLLSSGGLRYATTTGYFLAAFQAERPLNILPQTASVLVATVEVQPLIRHDSNPPLAPLKLPPGSVRRSSNEQKTDKSRFDPLESFDIFA